mgnify:CR=1 FL=1
MNNFLFSSEKNLTLFDTDNDYILFDISDELYAIKILDIKEIVSNRTIVEVEDLPEYIKGFANIRNIIFPIFELKQDLALENSKKYDAILVAVGHDKFKTLTQKEYDGLIKDEKLIIDVKGIVPNPTWKL